MKAFRPGWIAAFIPLLAACCLCSGFPSAGPREKDFRNCVVFRVRAPWTTGRQPCLAGDQNGPHEILFDEPTGEGPRTSQVETLDPAEEPSFWATLKPAGLDRLHIQVLEAKNTATGRDGAGVAHGGCAQDQTRKKNPSSLEARKSGCNDLAIGKIIASQRSDPGAKQARRLPEPAKPNTQPLSSNRKRRGPEISSALAAAAKDHKRVLLVFGGNWCYDCHVLDATFRSKNLPLWSCANYHVIHINIGNSDANRGPRQKIRGPA